MKSFKLRDSEMNSYLCIELFLHVVSKIRRLMRTPVSTYPGTAKVQLWIRMKKNTPCLQEMQLW